MLDTSSKRSPGIGGINATATQVYHWTTMTPIMRRTLATKAAHLFPIASKKERRNWVLNFHPKGGVFASVILATKRSGVFVGRCKPHRRWEIKEHVLHVHKYHITFSAVICMSYIMWTYFAQVEQRLEGGAEERRCERTQDCNVVDINLVCE